MVNVWGLIDDVPARQRFLEGQARDPRFLAGLRNLLAERFNEGELRTLCADLGVDFESLPPGGKADRARELMAYCERRGRVSELIELGRRVRPDVPWPSFS